MKAITYHYIREKDLDFPNIVYLHSKNFYKQIDFFDYKYGLISKENFISSLKKGVSGSNEIILTFDDGLSDHYFNVFKHLVNKETWGIFYISTGPYTDCKLLDVHRIHVILSNLGGHKALTSLRKILEPKMIDQDKVDEFQESTYKLQDDSSSFTEFKKILNYYVPLKWKSYLLDSLLRQNISTSEEVKIAKEYYLSIEQIQEMHNSGMMIGAHTSHHNVLSNLDIKEQIKEINDSCDFLSNCLGEEVKTFAYPYGTKKTYTEETQKIIVDKGLDFGFAVDGRDITNVDLKDNRYAMPRYDCNQFKFGKNESQFIDN